ncbi:hypothetical protein EZV62_002873 [Acer yangbiense]|uniref:ubiquitinyl hydrolase 1 n=1 Tax=Acer yangbiense TaxID=1000413 RepID=A0A5C7IZF6_9ROSI|nr:hypothetical protein EZV62_002873 [Acer yangbiense]
MDITVLPNEESSGGKLWQAGQKLQFCLLHSLNNLFQQKDAFTRASLNEIAEKLVLDDPDKQTWTPLSVVFKPHHNSLTGNYDINVLIAALEGRGKAVVWHDHRNEAATIDLDGDVVSLNVSVSITQLRILWVGQKVISMRYISGLVIVLCSLLTWKNPFRRSRFVIKIVDSIFSETHIFYFLLTCDFVILIHSEILDMHEYGYEEIGHLSRWKLGGNSYEGGLTKWIHVPRGLTYDALVKLV